MTSPLAVGLLSVLNLVGGPPDVQHREALGHFRAGRDLMRAERWDDAIDEFRMATRLDPLMSLAHYSLGQCYMATRRYGEAVGAFLGARESYHKLAALSLTDRQEVESRRREEIEELKDSIRLFESGRAKTSSTFAMVIRLESRLEQVESERAKDMSPGRTPPEISLSLGSAYFRNGALAEAEREYRAAVAAEAKMGEAHNNLAVVYMLTGRLEQAERELAAAEKAGFHVNPQLKRDLQDRRRATP